MSAYCGRIIYICAPMGRYNLYLFLSSGVCLRFLRPTLHSPMSPLNVDGSGYSGFASGREGGGGLVVSGCVLPFPSFSRGNLSLV